METKCNHCGNIFKAVRKERKFCSIPCFNESLRTGIYLSCEICKKTFYRNLGQIKWRGTAKFCSKVCKGNWMSLNKAGENSTNWKGGISNCNRIIRNSKKMMDWRKSVFERDNFTCQICKKIGGELNADHIKPFSLFPDFRFDKNNGRTLCVSCHRKTDTWGHSKMYVSKEKNKIII